MEEKEGATEADLSGMLVPGSDLKAQYLSIKEDIDHAIHRVLERGEFDRGEEVEDLEASIARYCEVKYAVGVGSGYAALLLALKACGIGPGDEVITVANTDMATVSAIVHTGATPVFVDVDPRTYNMDPALIDAVITPRTRAILPVHLYGLPADMDPIMKIANQHDLLVIEDACLALGAAYQGRPAGSIGDLGCFSFAPRKMLGAYGDGGIVVTNNPEWASRLRLWGGYGERRQFREVGPVKLMEPRDHEVHGYHSHLVTIQAAVLNAKLPYLDDWVARRQAIARQYDHYLDQRDACTPHVPDECQHAYRNYVIRVEERDEVRVSLAREGIHTDILYVPPIHLHTAFQERGYGPGDLPITEMLAQELLCLPMFPELSDEQVQYVGQSLAQTVSGSGAPEW